MSNPWTLFWTILLGLTLLAYTALAIHVTIGGYHDIKSMFRKLRERNEDGDGD